jgi:hypothetical protein
LGETCEIIENKQNMETNKIKRAELLLVEFQDLINSDPHFNYAEDEFEEWLMDLVIPNL